MPPSEGKASPKSGHPVSLETLVFAERLTRHRSRLIDILERLGSVQEKRALKALGISKGQSDDIARDAILWSAPAAPASEVYSGVLYDKLGFETLSKSGHRRAEEQVLIASALWGFLRPSDQIPYYRLSSAAKLPRLGAISGFWRPALVKVMDDREGTLVVDMRSGSYASAWRPKRARLLTVRAFSEQDGNRTVITHMAKETRGEVTRLLLESKANTKTAEDVAAVVEKAGYSVELTANSLDVIVSS